MTVRELLTAAHAQIASKADDLSDHTAQVTVTLHVLAAATGEGGLSSDILDS